MSLFTAHSGRLFIVGLAFLGTACVAGCSHPASQATGAELRNGFGAAADFLAPPTSETYVVHSSGSSAVRSSTDDRAVDESELDEWSERRVAGSFTISDGIMSSAYIAATAPNDVAFEFVLTEPVLFERQGRLSPVIVSVGSLTAESFTYPEVKVTFEPHIQAGETLLNTTIDVPDSVTGSSPFPSSSIVLELALEPSQP